MVGSAKAARKSILSFANKYAEQIKTRGITQAAEEYKVFERDPEFAIFLRKMESLEKMLKGTWTFIIDANKVEDPNPIRMLADEPGSAAPVRPPARPNP